MEENKGYRQAIERMHESSEWLKEAVRLVQEGTLDSLLRYYQTGCVRDVHLPSLVAEHDHSIATILAEKLMNLIGKTGFEIEMEEVAAKGVLTLVFKKEEYSCYFATLNPHERIITYHFDFDEMEREREMKISKLKTQRNEIYERYKDIQEYIKENGKGLVRYKNRVMIDQMKRSIEGIPEEISSIEKALKEITRDKELLEEIQLNLPDLQSELRRYGFLFEAKKGEDFEI